MSCLQKWKPIAVMVGVNFAMAVVNLLFKKVLNGGMNQQVITTYRLSTAATFLAPVACCRERKSNKKLTALTFCTLFFSALTGCELYLLIPYSEPSIYVEYSDRRCIFCRGTLTQYLFLIGLKYTSSTFSCAFINIVPINTFILALILRKEKINMNSKSGKAKVLGTIICIGGALVLTLYKGTPLTKTTSKDVEAEHDVKNWVIGSLFLYAGSLAWSSWYHIQDRVGREYPYQYSSTTIMSFLAAIQSAILCFIIERRTSIWKLKGALEISTILYTGIVGSGICFVIMSWCVKQKGPVFTSAFSPFIQIFAAILDVFLLHEQIHLGSILGSILVVIGLYILLWGKCKETEVCKNVQTEEKDGTILPVIISPPGPLRT
ncbi:PREDICTED: WAT1-related protein At3g30340-like isoform X1 [Ipomoea nil]|uniref:WAT1-related protein At3g30340-like isoform X1 n=1 Tax=Ipomoea nil TaxID=35883 RepID=UPI000900ED06|nr:PREDICTED: WAT1-related protein At3g30340-like isoform X1 [Ipomoea nil]